VLQSGTGGTKGTGTSASMRRYIILQVVSGTVMLAGLVATFILCRNVIERERGELQRAAEAEARRVAMHLQTDVLATAESLERLGKWWLSQGKPLDRDDWNTDGQLFLSRSPGLREAVWMGTDGYQYWVATPGADPNTTRIRPEDRVRDLVRIAQTRRSIVTSGVFDGWNMGAEFYVCVPLIQDKRIRGYVVGLYDAQALISSLRQSVIRLGNDFTVMSGGRTIYSTRPRNAGFAQENARADFNVAGTTWTIALRVPLNYFREFTTSVFSVGGIAGALIYGFGMLLHLSRRRSLELQRANIEVQALNRELNRKIADFQTLLEVIPIGIAVSQGPDCRNIRTNPALTKMLGIPQGTSISQSGRDAEELPARNIRDGRELRPEELPMQMAAATGKAVLGEEHQIVRADGSAIDILAFAAPLFDEEGRVRGVLNACVDISERKAQEHLRRELEQRLQRAQRMKSLGAMAAGIAHDFNNLLTVIIGEASLAGEGVPQNSDAARHIEACLEAAHNASKLINQMLAYTGRSYHSLSSIDLSGVIGEMRGQLAELAISNSDLRLHVAPGTPQVMADSEEIRQVLQNLVLNAVEATGLERGVIDILVDSYQISRPDLDLTVVGEELAPGDYVRVEVKDTGSGMAPEIAERAFDPFFSTKFLGRGLGLSEVLGVMRAHNGAVQLKTVPDGGTSVTLFFPAAEGAGRSNGNTARLGVLLP
jgi:PAS domain S-box-containing protein